MAYIQLHNVDLVTARFVDLSKDVLDGTCSLSLKVMDGENSPVEINLYSAKPDIVAQFRAIEHLIMSRIFQARKEREEKAKAAETVKAG